MMSPKNEHSNIDDEQQAAIAAIIAEQNDTFRKTLGGNALYHGQFVMTQGAAELSSLRSQIINAVVNFNTFDEDINTYGERNFGVFEVTDKDVTEKLFWKIVGVNEVEELKAMGLIVGDRDPNMNTNYDGKFMVAEPVKDGDPYPTVDAADGRFCIVGDDIDAIANIAYQHFKTD